MGRGSSEETLQTQSMRRGVSQADDPIENQVGRSAKDQAGDKAGNQAGDKAGSQAGDKAGSQAKKEAGARETLADSTDPTTINKEEEGGEERVTRMKGRDYSLTVREQWQGDEKVSSATVKEVYRDGVRIMVLITNEWHSGEKKGFSEEIKINSNLLLVKRLDSEGKLHSHDDKPSTEWRSGGYWSHQYHKHGNLVREISGSPEKEAKSIAEKLDDLVASGGNMLKTMRRRFDLARELTSLFVTGMDDSRIRKEDAAEQEAMGLDDGLAP